MIVLFRNMENIENSFLLMSYFFFPAVMSNFLISSFFYRKSVLSFSESEKKNVFVCVLCVSTTCKIIHKIVGIRNFSLRFWTRCG